MNHWPKLMLIGLFATLGYLLSLVSIVMIHTKNDNLEVFMGRVSTYGEKTIVPFIVCCLVLALPFIKGVLAASSFKQHYVKLILPGLLVAVSMNLVFFINEAFPDLQFSSSTPQLWWWILKESAIGLLSCSPSLALTTGCLSFALKNSPRLSF